MNIVITGAGRGIGLQTVVRLAKDPENHILALSRNTKNLEMLKEDGFDNIAVYQCDITNINPDVLVEKLKPYPHIDILINNAGQLINKAFTELSLADWRNMFEVNLFGTVEIIQLLLPHLHKSPKAHIVNIGSMGGMQGSSKFPGLSAYSASKAAITNLTECLAEELNTSTIKVNCLALGSVNTEMLANAFPGYKAPLSSEEMAQFIAYFSLNGHHFMNGKTLPVSLTTP